jgi:phosphoglycerate kinase
LQFIEEINALKRITSKIKRPVTCIIGGSKISTKIKIISNLIKDFDNIVIVGGMGNAMLKNTGVNIGKSVCDDGYKDLVEEILKKSKTHNCQIYYPLDVVVSKTLDGVGIIKEINEVNNDEMILDIGPKTITSIKDIIEGTNTVLWLIKHHSLLKDSQIAKLVSITKNSVTSIRNKSYWNYNNLNPKDPVAMNLFTQKDLIA